MRQLSTTIYTLKQEQWKKGKTFIYFQEVSLSPFSSRHLCRFYTLTLSRETRPDIRRTDRSVRDLFPTLCWDLSKLLDSHLLNWNEGFESKSSKVTRRYHFLNFYTTNIRLLPGPFYVYNGNFVLSRIKENKVVLSTSTLSLFSLTLSFL